MAKITKTIYNVPATCTGDGGHSWITGAFRIDIDYNSNKTGYSVKVYGSINSSGEMNWSGKAALKVTCNGTSRTADVNYKMYSENPSASGLGGWDGPATFEFKADGDLNLKFTQLLIDLTPTTGSNGKRGVYHRSDGGNITGFSSSTTISVAGIPPVPETTVPVIANLTNTNPYRSNGNISASTNSISLKWNQTGGSATTSRAYSLNNFSSYTGVSGNSCTVSGLNAGTSYTVYVRNGNSAGNSNVLSRTIRTRYATPVISLESYQVGIDYIRVHWTSDTNLQTVQYQVNSTTGSWSTDDDNGRGGILDINNLTPNTQYTIYCKGTSTDAYDAIESAVVSIQITTRDVGSIGDIGEIIFGTSFTVNIDVDTEDAMSLRMWVGDDAFEDTVSVTSGSNTIELDQDQWDTIYKTFPNNANNVTMHFELTTTSEGSEGSDFTGEELTQTVKLTGIARTAHIGVSNTPRRADVFIGVNGTARRCVAWVGDSSGKPRRCI